MSDVDSSGSGSLLSDKNNNNLSISPKANSNNGDSLFGGLAQRRGSNSPIASMYKKTRPKNNEPSRFYQWKMNHQKLYQSLIIFLVILALSINPILQIFKQ